MREFFCALALFFASFCFAGEDTPAQKPAEKVTFPLPAPSKIGAEKFSAMLNAFLMQGDYEKWKQDLKPRATGPYKVLPGGEVVSLGIHGPSAVKICYSPEVYEWIEKGFKGPIRDGGMLIKLLYARNPTDPAKFSADPTGFSIMVKDSKGSWDGWFYSDGGPLQKPSREHAENFFDPNAGFALSCINCHASADNPEGTFSSLRNLTSEPINHPTTISPEGIIKGLMAANDIHAAPKTTAPAAVKREVVPWPYTPARVIKEPEPLPIAAHDHVAQGPRPDGHRSFITSSNCMSCHDAVQLYSALPNMALKEGKDGDPTLTNLSPYSEWRYSMMGLAGRDPVFRAQLESERALHPELADHIDNSCLSCHSVMGQRQFKNDHGEKALFTHKIAFAAPESEHGTYSALARDGVSCVVCHQMQPDGLGTPKTFNGKFSLEKNPKHMFGPFEKTNVLPMENALGLTPKLGAHLSDSKLCASCHTIALPALDVGKKYTPKQVTEMTERVLKFQGHHEQATYLEWKNSAFSTENGKPGPEQKSCQDCHMPRTYKGQNLRFKIANIEDDTFPEVEHRAPDDKLRMEVRDKFSRHALHGINLFSLELFNQNPWLLGVQRKDNLAPAARSGYDLAKESARQMATEQSAKIEILEAARTAKGLSVKVRVTNLTGHKFPTGVAFRRAFVELKVKEGLKTVWVSGDTNQWGVIGTIEHAKLTPLKSEFFENREFQPHHQTITREDQVQIYEELIADSKGEITTSFLSLKKVLKDNRLLPKGWSAQHPEAAVTHAVETGGDEDYKSGSGSDTFTYDIALNATDKRALTVSAELFYQALPPYYLQQRFKYLDQPETQRLYYLINTLDLNGTDIDKWKLLLSRDSKKVD